MKLYKLKLLLLVLLGYAYIFSVVALLLLFIALLFWSMLTGKGLISFVIQFEIALIIVTAVILRSLWVRFCPPEGLRLTEQEQPQLFAMINELRRALRAAKIHSVLVTEELNASVVSMPRLGLFAWPRHHLLIGFPLLHALSALEFRAIIAHEIAHLANAHGRFSSWIYRINSTWFRLRSELTGRKEWALNLFNRFLQWYEPYFSSYSAILLRNHELKADLSAAELTTAHAMATALIRIEICRPFVGQFWRDLWERTTSESSPPPAFSELSDRLRGGIPNDDASRWLERALSIAASNIDSHPSLSTRLKALEEEAKFPEPIVETAAEFYLNSSSQQLVELLNRNYQERFCNEWKSLHQEFQAAANELRELNGRAADEELTIADAYRRASLTAEVGSCESALLLYRDVVDRDPDHATANFELGQLLLREKQDEGIRFLERAMELNEDYVYSACQTLYSYLIAKPAMGDHIAGQNYLRRAAAQWQRERNAQAERNEVSFLDRLTTHDLPHEKVEQLRRELAQDRQVREAYLVRKAVKYKPHNPLYALGVIVDRPWYKEIRRQWSFTKQFAYQLKSPLTASAASSRTTRSLQPFEVYSFELGGHDKRLRATLRNIENSLIYKRT